MLPVSAHLWALIGIFFIFYAFFFRLFFSLQAFFFGPSLVVQGGLPWWSSVAIRGGAALINNQREPPLTGSFCLHRDQP